MKYLTAVRQGVKISGLFFFTAFFTSSCSLTETWFEKEVKFPTSRVEVKVSNIPNGQIDFSSAHVITLAEAKSLKPDGTKIRLPNLSPKSTSVVAAKQGKEIRLIDFAVPGVNDQPLLSFESTARSLVFMNPIFAGLPLEQRVDIFKEIERNAKFSKLVQLVSNSQSILDDKVVELSSEIALEIAKSQFEKNQSLTPASQSTPLVKSVKPNSSPNPFDQEQFPKPSCGDTLPTDAKMYPVKMHPVFIDYSESNLQAVKTRFCQDAFSMKRKKTGKQSIQVSSFVTLERANAFKEFLLKNLGSGEVGETTIIESPPTSKANNNLVSDIFFPNIKEQDNWLDFIVPQASANLAGKLEYQVTQQFGDDGKIFPSISLLSPFHKIKLEATSEGIKVEGASLIAQQIVVIPADKFTPGKIDFNDYGGQMKKEADVVGELYLKPADLGIWDLTTLRTITGNSNISELIKPKSSVGNTWKPGDYLVLMSGGPSLNRNGQDEKGNPRNYGAYTLNLTTQIVDLLGMIGFVTDKKPVEVANSIAPILLDCGTQPNLSEFIKCFSKPDNNTKVAQALGLEEKEIIESVFGLLKFQGESAKKVAKNLGKTINIGDKVVTFSRYLLWADYQSREIINGVYFGKFTVTEQPPNPTLVSLSNATNVNKFEEVNIACGRIPSGKFYDLEFGSCHVLGSIAAKNYSTNWYEIAQSEG
jgi:hypothetical protein